MVHPNFWLPVMVAAVYAGAAKVAQSYDRPPPRETLVISLAEDAHPTTPQQVRKSINI